MFAQGLTFPLVRGSSFHLSWYVLTSHVLVNLGLAWYGRTYHLQDPTCTGYNCTVSLNLVLLTVVYQADNKRDR